MTEVVELLGNVEALSPGAPPILNFIAEDVVIDKPIITSGGDVFIACSSLKFVGNGVIDTGYPGAAGAGADGRPAGNITIVAHSIDTLRLRTTGQAGGKGYTGATGSTGSRGADGASGANAQCRGSKSNPSKAGRGGNGAPGGDGGRGGVGGPGRQGGASGNITIRFVDSVVELIAPPSGVSLTGGAGGAGGAGGSGGSGGGGGSGGAGGDGVTCTRTYGMGENIDSYEVSEGSAPGGSPGGYGRSGPSGIDGLSGPSGAPGHWLPERLSPQSFSDIIVGYLPKLVGGQIRKAELLMMLNQRPEAEALLKKIASVSPAANSPEAKVYDRAKLLLDRLDVNAARNFYNRPVFWAPVLLKEVDGGKQVLKTQDDLRNDLNTIRDLLAEATKIATYRSELVYRSEQAVRAYEFERRQLDSRISDIANRIKNAPADLAALAERLGALEAQALALKDRVKKLVEFLAGLPAEIVQKGTDLVGSITSMAVNIGGAIVAAEAGHWAVAGSLVLKGLADLQKGLGTAQDLLNLRLDVENNIDLAKQELSRVGGQISAVNNEIRQLGSRQADDAMSQEGLAQTQNLLTSFQLNQDLGSLRRLRAVSEDALWTMRVSVAEQLHTIRRFIDLRLGRADALKPMSPPGGVDNAFSYEHLLAILMEIQGVVIQAPALNVIDWDMEISGDALTPDLERLSSAKLTNFAVIGAPKFMSRGRLRNIRISMLDHEERAVDGYFELSHTGGTTIYSESASFVFDNANWIFRTKPGAETSADQRFAYRQFDANWAIQALEAPRSPIAKVKFAFDIELDSVMGSAPQAVMEPDAALEVIDIDLEPEAPLTAEWIAGSDEWLRSQSERLETLVELRDRAIARTLSPDGDDVSQAPVVAIVDNILADG